MNRYLFYLLLLLGAVFRLMMLTNYELVNGGEVDVYLADEGVVGLMGKHILEGKELPIFFYGQHYLGALEAYVAAVSFAAFGVNVLALRVVTLTFSFALAVLVYRFTYKVYSVAAARWATALVAVAPIYFLQWNLKARGGFVEHLVLVFVIMLLFWRFYLDHRRATPTALALGLACGVALWVNQLVLAYLIPIGLLVLFGSADRRGWLTVCVGGLLGASLLIGYNVAHPLATFKTLGRKAVVLNRVPVDERDDGWLVRGVGKRVEALSQGVAKLGLVFGVPPGESVERLGLSPAQREGGALTGLRRGLAFLPLTVFGCALLAAMPRRGKNGWEPLGSDQLLAIFALVTCVVGYVSPRYMLVAYPIAAVMAGVLATRLTGTAKTFAQGAVLLVVVFNMAGWADAMTVPADDDEARGRELLAFLAERDLTACYSAAPLYHLVFESGETVILSPLQKDRYPPHNDIVERSDSLCYVFREDQEDKRQHVAMMRLLEAEGVSFQTDEVGVYRVLSGLSPRAAITGDKIDQVRTQETVRVDVGGVLEGG